ncbi:unnamed protein product [Rotaria sordida]|uniref:Uncharacterized protein n=1 Tax=Rotaria sordida TaxID=392033 RepID=A0A814CN03_9BILA|nr:unnamed protein product [Rotaria sordida]CAF1178644.1 unnamed protein product [Rotaria sordida]CAF3589666.1 unnamed protein product [Rotaria sordida]CAF3648888.1 unnamed protein product [Rotaria sordida]
MATEHFNDVLNKFETIDQSCRAILEHCSHSSSLDVVTDMTHRLQHAIETLQLASLTMNQPPNNLGEIFEPSTTVESYPNDRQIMLESAEIQLSPAEFSQTKSKSDNI